MRLSWRWARRLKAHATEMLSRDHLNPTRREAMPRDRTRARAREGEIVAARDNQAQLEVQVEPPQDIRILGKPNGSVLLELI